MPPITLTMRDNKRYGRKPVVGKHFINSQQKYVVTRDSQKEHLPTAPSGKTFHVAIQLGVFFSVKLKYC